jgi:photosystem II stability/assembly factor-like uncharacterized protein
MKYSSFVSLNIVTCIFLLISFPVYSQTMDIKKSGVQTFLIEKYNSFQTRIVPSYGSDFLAPDIVRNSKENFIDDITGFNWTLKFSAPGKVFKDISFADNQVGYIVTELGAVYKSTNGGDNWTLIMNLGFPYYWYGVDALSPDTVVIAGFNNQGDIHSGVLRWSFDGGATWTNDIILHIPPPGVGWLTKVHFFDPNRGIVSAEFSGGMHYTANGGRDSSSWTYVQVNSDLGWFAGNIDATSDGNVFTTGIHFAHSSDYGINWTSGPSADYVFDGGVDFLDNILTGLTGGGQISAPVSGWTHKTIDGGQSWSQRLYTFPYPIRSVKCINDTTAFAFGGNLYDEAGGIYSTTDAGLNWNLDVSTGAEMFSFDSMPISSDSIDIWCVGSTGGSTGFVGKLYKARIPDNIIVPVEEEWQIFNSYQLEQNFPNPFNPSTKIRYTIPSVIASGTKQSQLVTLKVYDVLGSEVASLVNEEKPAGSYEAEFTVGQDSRPDIASGVYFYRLQAGSFVETKKMLLLK